MDVRTIQLKKTILENNDQDADLLREQLKADGTYYMNIMSSPGSGKTTTLLGTIKGLQELGSADDCRERCPLKVGVMEADIDSNVDAKTIAEKAGVPSIQLHTGGMCHLDADMSRQGLREIGAKDLDLVFLENVGNLVCPAEFDTGAVKSAVILSIPEGDDKPLKYPLMFTVTQAVLVNKTDTRKFFAFDDEAFVERVHALNPLSEIFFVSAKTGEGFDAWISWLRRQIMLSKAM